MRHAQDGRMRAHVLLLLVLIAASSCAIAADEVTIYRCTDTSGHLTLGDTPCRKDQKQQTRTMLRPKDAPRTKANSPMAPIPRDGMQAPRIVVVHAPRPLYECIPEDGEPYTSDSGEGRPRWVPLWTLGYPGSDLYSGSSGTQLAITHGGVHIDGGRTTLTPPLGYGPAAYGAGTWIRDACYVLPQEEVCSRLVDRRDAIRRRFFNAMPSERDTLNVEERGINARLDNDCGTR